MYMWSVGPFIPLHRQRARFATLQTIPHPSGTIAVCNPYKVSEIFLVLNVGPVYTKKHPTPPVPGNRCIPGASRSGTISLRMTYKMGPLTVQNDYPFDACYLLVQAMGDEVD